MFQTILSDYTCRRYKLVDQWLLWRVFGTFVYISALLSYQHFLWLSEAHMIVSLPKENCWGQCIICTQTSAATKLWCTWMLKQDNKYKWNQLNYLSSLFIFCTLDCYSGTCPGRLDWWIIIWIYVQIEKLWHTNLFQLCSSSVDLLGVKRGNIVSDIWFYSKINMRCFANFFHNDYNLLFGLQLLFIFSKTW